MGLEKWIILREKLKVMDSLRSGRYFGKCEHYEYSLYLHALHCCLVSLIAASTSDVLTGEYKGEKVEVKSLKDECKGLEDFLMEASVLTSLSHPNLVKLIGVSVDQKPAYFITEFMEKGSLYWTTSSPGTDLPFKNHIKLDLLKNVCSGMAYLEQRDLVHRCVVMPQNVFVYTCACKYIGRCRHTSKAPPGQ